MRSQVRRIAGILGLAVVLGACSPPAPEVPAGPDGEPDPVLLAGREVWETSCVQCHGGDGGGGRGPQLNDGVVIERYPDPVDQLAVIARGRGGMPSFDGSLSDDELEAVLRYTREVIAAD